MGIYPNRNPGKAGKGGRMNKQGGQHPYYHSKSKRDSARTVCWLAVCAVCWLAAVAIQAVTR